MSKQDELNWSADLRRIAWWLQIGNLKMAKKFITRGQELYSAKTKLGKRSWQWWFKEIKRKESEKAAERALTWSLLLK